MLLSKTGDTPVSPIAGSRTVFSTVQILCSPKATKKPTTRVGFFCLVGTGGFEPSASCSQSKRSTRLSYVPLKNFTFTIISDILLCSPRWLVSLFCSRKTAQQSNCTFRRKTCPRQLFLPQAQSKHKSQPAAGQAELCPVKKLYFHNNLRYFALLPQNRSTTGQSMLNAQYLIQNKLKCKLNFSTLQSTHDL